MDIAHKTRFNLEQNVGDNSSLPFHQRSEGFHRLTLSKLVSKTTRGHIVAFLGEGLGTFLFLFFGFAGIANSQYGGVGDVVSSALYVSIAFGFALLVNAWTFFRISGGLFNPAVTWGMWLIGALDWSRALIIFVAQISGAILASAFTRALYYGNVDCRTSIASGTNLTQALFIETIMTLQLVLVIFLLAAEKHKATFIAPVGIGLALFSGLLASVRYTGGSMNPARSFGPAITHPGFQSYHWIYWVGPLLGSTIAAVIYKLMKALDYEDANPGQDDTGEKMIVVQDGANLQDVAEQILGSANNTPPPKPTMRRVRSSTSISDTPMTPPRLSLLRSGASSAMNVRSGSSTTYDSGPRAEGGRFSHEVLSAFRLEM